MYPICGIIFSYTCCYLLDLKVYGLTIGLGLGKALLGTVLIYIIFFKTDWEERGKEREKLEHDDLSSQHHSVDFQNKLLSQEEYELVEREIQEELN